MSSFTNLIPVLFCLLVLAIVVTAVLGRLGHVRHQQRLQVSLDKTQADLKTANAEREAAMNAARSAREAREQAEKEASRLRTNAKHTKEARLARGKVDNAQRTFTLMRDRIGELENLAENAAEHLAAINWGDGQ